MHRRGVFSHIDWFLFSATLAISLLGLVTMHANSGDSPFFDKQIFWIAVAIAVFLIGSQLHYDFLKRTGIITGIFVFILCALAFIYLFATVVKGAQNRFDLGLFAIQPSDPAKLILVAMLSKYFARRHIEIKHFRHILVSGAYAFLLMILIFFQPDLGSTIIVASIWLGMVLLAGISWKHLATLLIGGAIAAALLWTFALQPYQKARILTFVHPLTDIHGAGYNAYQATVAVGSGELFGKGIGFGTQSKLKFLPEYQTDFIFAAFAEEWGFIGVILLFLLYAIVLFRILAHARAMGGNFETLFAAGLAVYFTAQFIVHVGMNMGLLPITGTTIPFMSYGGSHLVVEYLALGMLMAMRRDALPARPRGDSEFVGPV